MIFTKRSDYGLRAALELAAHYDEGPLTATSIAESGRLPIAFVKKLMQELAAANVAVPVRGRAGGYALSRSPEQITARQVIEAFESLSPVSCLAQGLRQVQGSDCEVERALPCPLRPAWRLIGQRLLDALDSLTLADLLQRLEPKALEGAGHA